MRESKNCLQLTATVTDVDLKDIISHVLLFLYNLSCRILSSSAAIITRRFRFGKLSLLASQCSRFSLLSNNNFMLLNLSSSLNLHSSFERDVLQSLRLLRVVLDIFLLFPFQFLLTQEDDHVLVQTPYNKVTSNRFLNSKASSHEGYKYMHALLPRFP
ncbi:hypothetical protein H5410_020363 [Solanum commersonii]|uniref:Uncharacterized protein n=1 Tax=Solanum commersonii TaxID=4109 RepID=A0A9J5Z8U6_SOLCO|nr:hypothetical protein H5410_020363 [Solanum commersonii]